MVSRLAFFLLLFFPSAVLGIKPIASCIPAKCSTSEQQTSHIASSEHEKLCCLQKHHALQPDDLAHRGCRANPSTFHAFQSQPESNFETDKGNEDLQAPSSTSSSLLVGTQPVSRQAYPVLEKKKGQSRDKACSRPHQPLSLAHQSATARCWSLHTSSHPQSSEALTRRCSSC